MRIKVRYFAWFREAAGKKEEDMEISDSAKVSDLLDYLVLKYPAMKKLPWGESIYLLNHNIVNEKAKLSDGDDLALLPPAGGG
jgi:molybdopterin synthase sulfur carrier subunit